MPLYQLTNKDVVVAMYGERWDLDDYYYDEVERGEGACIPIGFRDINDWIGGRAIAKHRASIERLMR